MIKFLLVAILLAYTASAQMWPSPGPGHADYGGGGGGGQAWTDSFTRGFDNTDLTVNCFSEGPNDDCGWIELNGLASIVSDELSFSATTGRVDSDTDTDTKAHYSAARYTGTVTARNQGPTIRGNGSGGGGDCFYVFRFQSDSEFQLRVGDTISSASTITAFTDGGGDFTDMMPGDSLGLSTDAAAGDAVEFTVWKFDARSPPVAFSNWAGSASDSYTVCASGCDKAFEDSDPSDRCNAEGLRPGIYNGSGDDGTWDDWVGGDT